MALWKAVVYQNMSNGQDDEAQSKSLEPFEGRLYMPCVLWYV